MSRGACRRADMRQPRPVPPFEGYPAQYAWIAPCSASTPEDPNPSAQAAVWSPPYRLASAEMLSPKQFGFPGIPVNALRADLADVINAMGLRISTLRATAVYIEPDYIAVNVDRAAKSAVSGERLVESGVFAAAVKEAMAIPVGGETHTLCVFVMAFALLVYFSSPR